MILTSDGLFSTSKDKGRDDSTMIRLKLEKSLTDIFKDDWLWGREKFERRRKRAIPPINTLFLFWFNNSFFKCYCSRTLFGGGGNRTRVRRHSTRGVYTLILFSFLVLECSKRKNTTEPAPILFRFPGSGQTWFAILLDDASQAPQENARETACLLLGS